MKDEQTIDGDELLKLPLKIRKLDSSPQGIVDRVVYAIKPMLDDIKLDAIELRQKQALKSERDEVLHTQMLDTLNSIKEQTTKTNGRVSELEKLEVLNKIVRYVLSAAALALFAMEGGKIIDVIK